MASRMLSSLVPSPDLSSRKPQRQPTRSASGPDLPPPVPALTRTAVSLEYASLRHTGHCPLGMYVTPSPDNLMVWDAVFFVHQGSPAALVPSVAIAHSVQDTTPTPYSSSGSPFPKTTRSDRLSSSSSPTPSIHSSPNKTAPSILPRVFVRGGTSPVFARLALPRRSTPAQTKRAPRLRRLALGQGRLQEARPRRAKRG